MVDLRSVSGVARPLDFDHPTNRWISAVTATVFLILWLGHGLATGAWMGGALAAFLAALAVLLAWALCRELDPDLEMSALVGAGFCVLALIPLQLLSLGGPGIPELFAVLLAMRVLNRTTGLPATPWDAIALIVLGLWIAQQGDGLYLVLAILAVGLDGLLVPQNPARSLAALTVAALVGAWVLAGPIPTLPAPTPVPGVLAIALAALLLPAVLGASSLQTRADDTGETLSPLRVRVGQALALVVGITAGAWQGWAGLLTLLPLWAAIIAAGGYRLARPYLRFKTGRAT